MKQQLWRWFASVCWCPVPCSWWPHRTAGWQRSDSRSAGPTAPAPRTSTPQSSTSDPSERRWRTRRSLLVLQKHTKKKKKTAQSRATNVEKLAGWKSQPLIKQKRQIIIILCFKWVINSKPDSIIFPLVVFNEIIWKCHLTFPVKRPDTTYVPTHAAMPLRFRSDSLSAYSTTWQRGKSLICAHASAHCQMICNYLIMSMQIVISFA